MLDSEPRGVRDGSAAPGVSSHLVQGMEILDLLFKLIKGRYRVDIGVYPKSNPISAVGARDGEPLDYVSASALETSFLYGPQ